MMRAYFMDRLPHCRVAARSTLRRNSRLLELRVATVTDGHISCNQYAAANAVTEEVMLPAPVNS